jgi:hypothetical protein
MKIQFLLIAVSLTAGFSISAQAQSQFAGRYDLLAGVSTGDTAGLFSYGTATVGTNGRAAYTVYWPYLGTSGSGSGLVNSRGVFAFTDGTSGSAQFYAKRVAVGTYRQSYGRGFFALRKK